MARRSVYKAIIVLAACAWCFTAQAQLAVTALSIQPQAGGVEEVHFATTGIITPKKLFGLGNPDRAVVDLPLVQVNAIALPSSYGGGLVKAVRAGQFDRETVRIVVETTTPVSVGIKQNTPSELVVVLTPLAAVPEADRSASSPFVALEAPVPASTTTPLNDKPLIVIDAGHGGQDPGALGLNDTHEKDVTLMFAQALKDGLLRTGRYRVALTREDDRFIMLPERGVSIARRMKGDLFISLHADSNPNADAHGLSIYSLSENASDAEAAALAERENKADILPGLNLNTADEDVASILIDLAQRETMNKSARFADTVVASLHPKISRLQKTHRFAGFRVLKAPDIPSVLIELGFLSNKDDERLLQSKEYQSLVVDSLIRSLDKFKAQEKL